MERRQWKHTEDRKEGWRNGRSGRKEKKYDLPGDGRDVDQAVGGSPRGWGSQRGSGWDGMGLAPPFMTSISTVLPQSPPRVTPAL